MSGKTKANNLQSQVKARLVLRTVTCPLNFVKTKIQLEKMEPGEVLEVTVDAGEPAINVPRSAASEGHEILARHTNPDGSVTILIRRA